MNLCKSSARCPVRMDRITEIRHVGAWVRSGAGRKSMADVISTRATGTRPYTASAVNRTTFAAELVGEGRGVACQRTEFLGDSVDCCLRNSLCTQTRGGKQCLDGKGMTCSDGKNGHPNTRSIVSTTCLLVLTDHFLAKNEPVQRMVDRWMDSSSRGCMYFMERVINIGSECEPSVDKSIYKKHRDGTLTSRALLIGFMKRFNSEFGTYRIPSDRWSASFHPVQDGVYEFCVSKSPRTCCTWCAPGTTWTNCQTPPRYPSGAVVI